MYKQIVSSFALIVSLLSVSFSSLIVTTPAIAQDNFDNEMTQSDTVTLGNFIKEYTMQIASDIPDSYQYVELAYTNINSNSDYYESLQKMVYLNLLPNKSINFPVNLSVPEKLAAAMISKHFKRDVDYRNRILDKRTMFLMIDNLPSYLNHAYGIKVSVTGPKSSINNIALGKAPNFGVLNDAYQRLTEQHINSKSVEHTEVIHGAIKGMTTVFDDKYTTYTIPQLSDQVTQNYQGEYEGIGASVELIEPGRLLIVGVMSGSPAKKAGVLGDDIVVAIDGEEIDPQEDLPSIVSRIKGAAGTEVTLTIIREGEEDIIDIVVTRGKISVNFVEREVMGRAFYIKINSFGKRVDEQFDVAMQEYAAGEGKYNKLIIDVRDNPGGDLAKASRVLRYFVPHGEIIVTHETIDSEEHYRSSGRSEEYELATRAPIYIVTNGGSASASEVLAGAIKYYHPTATLVGEQTYGKGTVQIVVQYSDSSYLRYTSGKRHIAGELEALNGIGILPDKAIDEKPETPEDEILDSIR